MVKPYIYYCILLIVFIVVIAYRRVINQGVKDYNSLDK